MSPQARPYEVNRREFTRLGLGGLGALFAGSTALTACSSSGSSVSTAGTGNGGSSPGSLAGKTVANSQSQPIEAITAFIADTDLQAKQAGNGEKIISNNAHGDDSLQLSQAQGFLTQGVNAVVFWGTATAGWAAFAKQATAQGVGVFTHNASALSNATQNIVLNQYQAGYGVGTYAAQWIKQNAGGTCDVGILTNTTDPQLVLRGNGFVDALKKLAPGAQIVGQAPAQTTPQGGSAASNLLSAHPGIKVILSASDDPGVGALSAAREAGHTDPRQFLLGSCDGSDRVLGYIKSGGIYQVTWDFLFPFSAVQMERDIESFLRGEKLKPTRLDPGILITASNLSSISELSNNPTSKGALAIIKKYMTTYSDHALQTDEPPQNAFPQQFGQQ